MESILPLIIQYKYLILFPLAAIEGPMLALASGFLISLGYLGIVPTYLVFVLGDVIPDVAYYWTGVLGNRFSWLTKYKNRWSIVSHNLDLIDRIWQDHPIKTMVLTKFAFGLSTPLLISAGVVKMPFRKFISLTLPISFVNYAVILTLGYYLGHSYQLAGKYLEYLGFLVFALAIVFALIYNIISRYARSKVLELEKEEEGKIIREEK